MRMLNLKISRLAAEARQVAKVAGLEVHGDGSLMIERINKILKSSKNLKSQEKPHAEELPWKVWWHFSFKPLISTLGGT